MKMQPLASASIKKPLLRVPRSQDVEQPIYSNAFTTGLITDQDPSDLDPSALALGSKNFYVRQKNIRRRSGFTEYITKPSSNPVVGIANLPFFDGTKRLTVFESGGVHYYNAGSWVNLTGPTLHGAYYNRFRVCAVNNRFFFTNDGIDSVMEINFSTNTYATLGNAGNYKYIVSFNNRILCAYKFDSTPDPTRIEWSGILNFNQFDPLTDNSAGWVSLIDAQSDYADDITGLYIFGSQLLVMRTHSIWLVNKQGSSASPFQFYNQVPSIGCDAPDSIQQTPNGLIWYDSRTNQCYIYQPGFPQPEAFGEGIRNDILNHFNSTQDIFSSYDDQWGEYTLYLRQANSSLVVAYTFSFIEKSWSYQEYLNVNACASTAIFSGGTVIDNLAGTIDQLNGTIDQLSTTIALTTKAFGLADGSFLIESPTQTSDHDTVSIPYSCEILSKNFQLPTTNEFISKLEIELQTRLAGSLSVYFTKDSGTTWNLWKVISYQSSTNRVIFTMKKLIRCRNFQFKLVAADGSFDILSYAIHVSQAGESRSGN